MSLESYVRAAPKVELHLHLEGAVRPTTLLQLAERNGIRLPYTTVEELRTWFRFLDFAHFGEVYGAVSRCLRTAEDYELIAYELAEELAGQQSCMQRSTSRRRSTRGWVSLRRPTSRG